MTKYRVERDFWGNAGSCGKVLWVSNGACPGKLPHYRQKLDEDFVKAMGMVKYAAAEVIWHWVCCRKKSAKQLWRLPWP